MRSLVLLSLILVGCVSPPRPVQEMPFVTQARNQKQKMLDTIDSAGIPDSHFEYSVDRSGIYSDFKLSEVARFSEIYLEAKQGRLKAIGRVGSHYYMGITPVVRNYTEAVKWFTLGADRDDPDCQVKLGECYALGLGVEIDMGRAKALLARASAQGSQSYRVKFSDTPVYVDVQTGRTSTTPSALPSSSFGDIPQAGQSSGTYEVAFDADPNGKASWQLWFKEFSGRIVRTSSREVYLKVLAAKADAILALNKMDLHTLYGQGTDDEKYEKFKELLREARVAQAELRRVVNLYGN